MLRILGLISALFLPFTAFADQQCQAQVLVDTEWYNVQNGTFAAALDITLSNAGSDNITVPYDISLQSPLYIDAPAVWSLQNVRVNNGNVTASATEFWETIMSGSRNKVNLGMIVEFNKTSSDAVLPASLTAGGVTCAIVPMQSAVNPAVNNTNTANNVPNTASSSINVPNNSSQTTRTGSPGVQTMGSPAQAPSGSSTLQSSTASTPNAAFAPNAAVAPNAVLAPKFASAPNPATASESSVMASPASSGTPLFSRAVTFAPLQAANMAPQTAPSGAPAP